MSRATPKMRNFAKRLTDYGTRENRASGAETAPTFRVCERLRAHLAVSVGKGGARELLSCALARANAEVPWLRAVRVKPDGQLEGLDALQAQVSAEERSEGEVVLVAHLLGMLSAFVGERLTLRQVREVWPQVPLSDLEYGKKHKHEKAE
jgi:hypothetical protein